ncbi:beta strand repeat-containing protein [Synechococcus sp. A10-1-5-9]|uniref:beta strand repeat-containing protein n=1 Tax=Synechococcus sp. A10-1-5-9 TaxID=3392295 RepID=UPI0039EA076D
MADVFGSALNDVLSGTPVLGDPNVVAVATTNEADQITALDGDDSILALGGDDLIEPGTGDDTVDGGEGNDTIIGSQGNDFLFGGVQLLGNNDTLTYEDSGIAITLKARGQISKTFTNNTFTGSAGTDQLVGSLGFPIDGMDFIPSIQTIIGDSTQVNTVDGSSDPSGMPPTGNGAFDINLSASTDNFKVIFVDPTTGIPIDPLVFQQTFTIENFANVIGTRNSDIIIGDDQDNVISGSSGTDNLDGLSGNDTLDYSGLAADINIGNFKSDGSGITKKTFSDPTTIEFDAFSGFETIIGSATGVNTIDGTLDELLSNTFTVDLSQELLTVDVNGTEVNYTVENFTNVIGTVNNDSIIGDAEDNTFGGSLGNDTLDGGDGFDTVDYSAVKDNSDAPIVLNAGGSISLGQFTTEIENVERIIASNATNPDLIDAATDEPNQASIFVDLELNSLFIEFLPSSPFPGSGLGFVVENFENVRGTDNNDVIFGESQVANTFFGSKGDDTYFGGRVAFIPDGSYGSYGMAENTLSYNFDGGLGGAIALGGSGLIDKGEFGTDTLIGDVEMGLLFNTINNIIADQNFRLDNTIDGSLDAEGNASFEVNLETGGLNIRFESGTFAGQVLNFDIENFGRVVGTVNDDLIIGNDTENNIFVGSFGNDVINGSFDDTLPGSSSNDVLDYSDLGVGITLLTQGQIAKGPSLFGDTILGTNGTDQTTGIDTIIGDASEINAINGVANGAFLDAGDKATFNIDLRAETFTLTSTLDPAPFGPITFNIENFSEVVGTVNDDVIKGSDSADDLDGEAGNDFVFGRKGDDNVAGGDGEDTLRGDSGNDTVSGGDGNDKIDGGGNLDVLSGDDGDDFISGKGGADLIDGGAGDDTLLGNAGNDTIKGSTGNDRINGGGRGDTLDYTGLGGSVSLGSQGVITKTAATTGDLGTDTLVGSGTGQILDPFVASIEEIIGDVGPDIVNTIDGTPTDPSDARASFDIDLSQDSLEISFTAGIPNLATQTYVVKNFDNVIGTGNDDSIIGNANDNTFGGSDGNDFLDGLDGSDTLDYTGLGETITLTPAGLTFNAQIIKGGDAGIDSIANFETIIADDVFGNLIDGSNEENAQFGIDLGEESLTIVLTNVPTFVPNPLEFTIKNFDQVRGTSSADFITGSEDDNIIFGSGGSDVIDGDGGVNTLDYSDLDTSIVLGGSGDILKEGLGTDTIQNIQTIIGSATQDNFIDGQLNAAGNGSFDIDLSQDELIVNISTPNVGPFTFEVINFDNVVGTRNTDSIVGNDNDNIFVGSAGDDTYDGLGGDDTLTYEGLGESITLLDTGDIEKGGSLGTDSIDNIETIVADSFASNNTINGENNAGVSFTVDLAAESLAVNVESVPVVINRTVVNFDDVFGTAGDDSITGDDQANILTGNDGDDVLSGGESADTLAGGDGNDVLFGGEGDDELDGTAWFSGEFGANDFDRLTGGSGADLFVLGVENTVYYEGIGFAEVLDFESGVDTLQLAGVASDYSFNSNFITGSVDILLNTPGSGSDLIAIANELAFSDITFV